MVSRWFRVWCLLSCACFLPAQPIIHTVAGSERGYAGDNAPAAEAQFAFADVQNPCDPAQYEQTSQIFADAEGGLWIADSANHRIRRIGPDGVVRTVAGSGERPEISSRCEPTGPVADGPAAGARLYNPSAVAARPDGALVIVDQQNGRIREVSAAGLIATIAGSGQHNLYAPGIPALASPMDWPTGLALDANGQVYFTELHGNRVARIDANGRLATVAGLGFPGSSGDGGRAVTALMRKPLGIAIDAAGNLYIADSGNHRIRRVGADGVITTVAGNGRAGFEGDGGPAKDASLNTPMDVKLDAAGNLYIADTLNHRVRRVGADGLITTVAGNGDAGRGEELIPATESSLSSPCAIALDAQGDLFVVDWQNYRIRKVVFSEIPVLTSAEAVGRKLILRGARFAEDVIVEVNGIPIPVDSVTADQAEAQIPADLGVGLWTARVLTASGTSNPVAFRMLAE